MSSEAVFILLFSVATAVAIAVRRLAIPYTVALVLAGLGLGAAHAFPAPHLTKELLFSVFLPGLLFEAAFHVDFEQFWRNKVTIASLAIPGVVVAMTVTTLILTATAGALHSVNGFSWRHALVFGALIAATDPIAVVAIFKELGAPSRLRILMEGESLFNDGTGIVFFTLALSLVSGGSVMVGNLALGFLTIAGVGLLIGVVIGLGVSQVLRRVDDAMIEITLTTVAGYGAFVIAEHLHYSGVIATVTVGMFCGNYGARVGMSPSTRVAVESFWEYMAFALNSVVFLLIGFEVRLGDLLRSWRMILVAYLAVTVARAFVVFASSLMLRPTRERIPMSWSVVLTWGGLRGALPMVLVLSLPPQFPFRDLLVTITFGVVILSILVHGVTVSPLLRLLGVVRGHQEREAYELARGRLQTARAALAELDEMARGSLRGSEVVERIRTEYRERISDDRARIEELDIDASELEQEQIRWARRHLIQVEKREALHAFQRGLMDRTVHERLLADIDARLLQIETEGASGPPPEAGEDDA